jgi:putative transposase
VIEAFDSLRSSLAVTVACQALGVARAAIYRTLQRRRRIVVRTPGSRPRPPLALSALEHERLMAVLNSERFVAMAPAAIYATLTANIFFAGTRTSIATAASG